MNYELTFRLVRQGVGSSLTWKPISDLGGSGEAGPSTGGLASTTEYHTVLRHVTGYPRPADAGDARARSPAPSFLKLSLGLLGITSRGADCPTSNNLRNTPCSPTWSATSSRSNWPCSATNSTLTRSNRSATPRKSRRTNRRKKRRNRLGLTWGGGGRLQSARRAVRTGLFGNVHRRR